MGSEVQAFAFTREELSVLLKISHSEPSPGSPLAQLSPGESEMGATLKNTFIQQGIVDEKGDKITLQWKEIVDVLSLPSWELTLIEAPDMIPRLVRYYPVPSGTQFVSYSQDEKDLHTISFFYTTARIAEEFHSRVRESEPIIALARDLPLAESLALLSVVDLYRNVYLESYMERCPDFLLELTPADLLYIFEKGHETNDFRWLVTIARIFSPRDLSLKKELLEESLKDMEHRQLVKIATSSQNELAYQISDGLERLCRALLDIRSFFALKVHDLRKNCTDTPLGLIYGRSGGIMISFREVSQDVRMDISHPQRSVISPQLETIFRKIEESSGKLSLKVQTHCAKCSRDFSGQERFCTFCGNLADPASSARAAKKQQKDGVQKSQQCPYCMKFNFIDAHFCRECGKRLSLDVKKICPQCNKSIKGESRFCRYCGRNFTGEQIPVSNLNQEAGGHIDEKKEPQSPGEALKPCPRCAKGIRRESLFCRFCGYNFRNKEARDEQPISK